MTTLNASKIVRTFVYFLLGGIALFALYIYIALNWSYSTGERAGFLQKVSNKGWICKTWEGELSLVAMPGAAPEKFLFTVRDEAIAQKISATAGKESPSITSNTKACPAPALEIPTTLWLELQKFNKDKACLNLWDKTQHLAIKL